MNLSSRPDCRAPFSRWGRVACFALLLAGCGRDQIQVYRVPKEKSEEAVASQTDQAPPAHLEWTAPQGWQERPPSKMRSVSFAVAGKAGREADVAVIPLLGITGRDLEVMNLWRDQVRLAPIGQAEMDQQTEKVKVGPEEGKLFDIASQELLVEGKHRARILVAMVTREGASWFFKMTGEDSLVSEQKPTFVQFLGSIRFIEGPPPFEFANANRPLSTNAKQAPSAAPTLPAWEVPPGWREQPAPAMVLASFAVAAREGGKAEVAVSALPADGGGPLQNVNRWRGQLSLAPVGPEQLATVTTSLEVTGGKAVVVDMVGTSVRTGQKARMVAAIVPRETSTWFYKLTGDEQMVGLQKEAFIKFVKTVNYPNG